MFETDQMLWQGSQISASQKWEFCVSPSLLESSSMVLGVGLDWMYTMGSPSGQFDRLQTSFNKLQLVLTITGLLLSILVSNPIVRGRRIASRW